MAFLFLLLLLYPSAPLNAEPPGVPLDMATVPAGHFWMGSNRGDIQETPLRRLYLPSFGIDRREVSQKAYRAFADSTGRKVPWLQEDARYIGEDRPALGVTWEEARAFCLWAGKRLPTEAEWEKTARGEDGRTYPWGEAIPNPALLNFADHLQEPAPVGGYAGGASPFGVLDLSGNVAEWVESDPPPARPGSGEGPPVPVPRGVKVVRGGAWNSGLFWVRASARTVRSAVERSRHVGFRCAISIEEGVRSEERSDP
jgi:iron(II)-dependent oxidoreductase